MSLGESDPRSGDSPQGEVIPISCSLVALKGRHEEAHVDGQAGWFQGSKTSADRVRAIAEQLRGICQALVAELQIAHKESKEEGVPEPKSAIRIEVTPAADVEASAGAQVAAEVMTGGDDEAAMAPEAPASSAAAEAPAVFAQRGVAKGGRRQVKIFNQGHTLILEFGHDRR